MCHKNVHLQKKPPSVPTAQPPTQTSLAAQSVSPGQSKIRKLPQLCHQLNQKSRNWVCHKEPHPHKKTHRVKTAQPLTQFSQAAQSVSPAQTKKEFGFAFGEIGMGQAEQR